MECSNCPCRGYSTRRALIRHIQISHPEEIGSVTPYKKIKTHECSSCSATFSTRRSLIRHWKHFHSSLISAPLNKKTWDCNECIKKYTNKFSWYKHKQLCHPNSNEIIERKLKKIFECYHCGRKYSYKRALSRHIQCSHAERFSTNQCTTDVANEPLICHICGKQYMRNTGYTLHMKRAHTREALLKRAIGKVVGFYCPICQTPFDRKSLILQHFLDAHRFNLVTKNMEFETRADFDEWQMRVERETLNNYSIRSSQTYINYKSILYNCSRSGFYQSRSTGRRSVKATGTRKINGFCPAEIWLKIMPDGRCQVQFSSTHVGHANELAHMRLLDHKCESIIAAFDPNVPVSNIMHKYAQPSSAIKQSLECCEASRCA